MATQICLPLFLDIALIPNSGACWVSISRAGAGSRGLAAFKIRNGTLEPWNPGTLEPWNLGTLHSSLNDLQTLLRARKTAPFFSCTTPQLRLCVRYTKTVPQKLPGSLRLPLVRLRATMRKLYTQVTVYRADVKETQNSSLLPNLSVQIKSFTLFSLAVVLRGKLGERRECCTTDVLQQP